MALEVKDAAAAAKKFASRGAAAGPDYLEGVRGAGASWQRQTEAGAANYASGVQEAIGRNAFQKGVSAAGAAKFEQRATTVGARRFPEGISEAGGAFAEGIAPYLDVLRGLTLEPRRPKGDPANWRRSEQVGLALRRRKVGG